MPYGVNQFGQPEGESQPNTGGAPPPGADQATDNTQPCPQGQKRVNGQCVPINQTAGQGYVPPGAGMNNGWNAGGGTPDRQGGPNQGTQQTQQLGAPHTQNAAGRGVSPEQYYKDYLNNFGLQARQSVKGSLDPLVKAMQDEG